MLGTFVEVTVLVAQPGMSDAEILSAINGAFLAIERVGRLMSFHDATSELSAINAARAGQIVAVHRWTSEVLAIALDVARWTDGLFDCNVGAALQRSGLLPMTPATPATPVARAAAGERSAHHGASPVRRPMHEAIALDGRAVHVMHPVMLDLGGIAKGYAVDRAVDALAEAGVGSAVVNAGGDLRVLGATPQPIHLRDATVPGRMTLLGELADGAIATSATSFTRCWRDGEWHSAIVGRGRAFDSPRSFSVLAPTCAVADALTKPLALGGALGHDVLAHFQAQAIVRP